MKVIFTITGVDDGDAENVANVLETLGALVNGSIGSKEFNVVIEEDD